MPGRERGRPPHPDVLTPGEQRVLEELRNGGTNAEIAARLGLSAETVKTHIARMLSKLDLPDRRALAAWRPGRDGAERRGWFAPLVKPLSGMGQAAVIVGLAVVLILAFASQDERTFVAVSNDVTLSAGLRNTCAIRGSGELVCWGANYFGGADAPGGTFRSVSVGGDHSCGLRESGEIACWGPMTTVRRTRPGGPSAP